MAERYIERFYGSCGHQENKEISKKEFEQLVSPHLMHGPVSSGYAAHETTVEGDTQVVHVYPHRYSVCGECMARQFASAFSEDSRG